MYKGLLNLSKEVSANKRKGRGPCKNCPMVKKHDGPVFIKHQTRKRPRVVVISESPAGYEEIDYTFSRLDDWTFERLKTIHTFEWDGKKIGQLNNLTKFLAGLTDSRMVSKLGSRATIGEIYWTHAMKCFIQKNEPSVKKAKKVTGKAFENACKHCAVYLREEVTSIEPELVVAIGKKALHALIPEERDLVGESILLPDLELVFTYHPGYWEAELKARGFTHARNRLLQYL